MNTADMQSGTPPPVLGLVMPWPREVDVPPEPVATEVTVPQPVAAADPRRELTKGQGRALRVAVGVVVAGMAMGFASSFVTLTAAARLHQWSVPALLPLSVDSGILAYVLLDHLAVTLGSRSRCLHWAAWSLAGFTVWANAAVSPADGATWRVIHAAMPALWVLGVEALRFMWRKLHEDPAGVSDRIPAGRWLAAPWPTLLMVRRMRLLNVTSYPYAVALAESAMLARDLVSADPGWGAAPVLLRDRIGSWRFPAPVHATIRAALNDGSVPDTAAAVQDMVTEELTRYDRHRGVLERQRADIARDVRRAVLEANAEASASGPGDASRNAGGSGPGDASRGASEGASREVAAGTSGGASRKAPRKVRIVPAKATNEELAEMVVGLFDLPEEVKPYGVIKAIKDRCGTGIGYPRADEVMAVAKRMHDGGGEVVQMEARRA